MSSTCEKETFAKTIEKIVKSFYGEYFKFIVIPIGLANKQTEISVVSSLNEDLVKMTLDLVSVQIAKKTSEIDSKDLH